MLYRDLKLDQERDLTWQQHLLAIIWEQEELLQTGTWDGAWAKAGVKAEVTA